MRGRFSRGSAGSVITWICGECLTPCCVSPLNPELEHSRSQRTRVQSKNLCSAEWTFNSPSGVLKSAYDVFAFDFFQSLSRYCFFRNLFKLINNLEHTSLRVYHGSLDHVCELADVSRPGVQLKVLHRPR